MSLHFISGKPGGGKSMYAVKLMIQELRVTQRNIVTNLPLNVGRLAEYLSETYGETFSLSTRLRVLTEDEVGSFWLHPAIGCNITDTLTIRIRGGNISRPDFKVRAETGGTFYILDEIHLHFNARRWQDTGEDCIFYLSQHRKLGDDILAVTQHIGNVDKQFRSLTQDYTILRNLKKERFGIFKTFPLFLRATYLQPPTGAMGERAMETGSFTLDVRGLGSCYDTASGVGIHNRGDADSKVRTKGIPIWFLFIAIGLVLFAAAKFPTIMAWFMNKKATPAPQHQKLTNSAANVTPRNNLAEPATLAATQVPVTPPLAPIVAAVASNPPVYINTSIKLNGKWSVWLSDGRRLTQFDDPDFESLGREGAVIAGELHKWHPRVTPAAGGKFFSETSVSRNRTVPTYGIGPAPRPNVTLRN